LSGLGLVRGTVFSLFGLVLCDSLTCFYEFVSKFSVLFHTFETTTATKQYVNTGINWSMLTRTWPKALWRCI